MTEVVDRENVVGGGYRGVLNVEFLFDILLTSSSEGANRASNV